MAEERAWPRWSRRMWRSLSVANIWACGVAVGEHDWGMSLAATFFALACWHLSDARVSVLTSEPTSEGGE